MWWLSELTIIFLLMIINDEKIIAELIFLAAGFFSETSETIIQKQVNSATSDYNKLKIFVAVGKFDNRSCLLRRLP